jgi:hypothetical protein
LTRYGGGPGIQNIGIFCFSGFRARAFGAPRNDGPEFSTRMRHAGR